MRPICDREVLVHARDGLEPLRFALAHALYERVAASGDRRLALLAMGELYATLSLPLRLAPLGPVAAAELLVAEFDPAPCRGRGPFAPAEADRGRPSAFPEALLVAAANRIGCVLLARARREAGRTDGGEAGADVAAPDDSSGETLGELLERLEGCELDPRLPALLA